MLDWLRSKISVWKPTSDNRVGSEIKEFKQLSESLEDNMYILQAMFDGCADFVYKEFIVCGRRAVVFMVDNMVDKVALTEGVMNPLVRANAPNSITKPDDLFVYLRDCVLSAIDAKEIFTIEDCVAQIMEGFVVFLYDGVSRGITVGLQGFKIRSIDEPSGEKVLRGSREGFVEALRINMALVRRRVKNPRLKFRTFTVGKDSCTDVCIAYIQGIASESVVNEVIRRLNQIDLDSVMASGYLQSFFENNPMSLFPTVGTTERPDTLCGKLEEGRVAVMVDNTPVMLVMPYLLVENFQNMDDYAVGHYYATFTRILKYLAFTVSFLTPGLYVAVGGFHQSILPVQLVHTLAQAEADTPFSIFVEAMAMQLIYEMLREAGLRLPKQFGFAINIVGAFIIGQAAVQAGLIGAPMVIIVALTATTSLVVPSLYEPTVILRFAFIILAGMSGLFGVFVGLAFLLIHLFSLKTYDVPYTAPVSPLDVFSLRDVVFRAPWGILARKKAKVQEMPGSDIDKTQN